MAEYISCGICHKMTEFNNPQVPICHECYKKGSRTPVIDAGKLAEIIDVRYSRWAYNEWINYPGEHEATHEIAQLITDSLAPPKEK